MAAAPESPAPAPVVLFDGECGLCQRLVRWLLRIDRRAVLHFAPLQGPAAQEFLRLHGLPVDDFESLVLVRDWSRREDPEAGSASSRQAGPGQGRNFALRTDGVIAALRAVGATRHAALLALWPRGWRDAGYRLVARWRHRVCGPWKSSLRPRPEWAGRFLE